MSIKLEWKDLVLFVTDKEMTAKEVICRHTHLGGL